MIDPEIIARLKVEINRTDKKTEIECGNLLKEIAWVLLLGTDSSNTFVETELICISGRVDLSVIVDYRQFGGARHRKAYLWELKAPQLPPFILKTNSRAHPSLELYSAETQLMHYCYELRGNKMKQEEWEIQSSDYVMPGGIIIGRDSNLIGGNRDINQYSAKRLALTAQKVRETYFYRPANITLLTWDHLIDVAEDQTASRQSIENPPSNTDYIGSASSTSSSIVDIP